MQDIGKGAFWKATDKQTGQPKQTKQGLPFWNGNVELNGTKYPAVMFFNRQEDKKNPKAPDFNIIINAPQAPQTNQGYQAPTSTPERATDAPVASQGQVNEPIAIEDIPF